MKKNNEVNVILSQTNDGGKNKMEYEEIGIKDFWKPEEKGATLEGEITAIDLEAAFGTEYTIKTEEGEITTPGQKVLQSILKGTKVGDKIKIVYDGEKAATKPGNNPTKLYKAYKGKE